MVKDQFCCHCSVEIVQRLITKTPMNKTVIVSEDTHKLLKEYCQSEGIKTQHLADRIIREWLEKKKEAK